MSNCHKIFDVKLFLQPLHRDGDVFEVRAFGCEGKKPGYTGWTKSIVSGYFDNIEDAAKCIEKLDKFAKPDAIYVTLNPVNPALLARAANRLQGSPKATTADKDIRVYRNLLLDFDPVRPSGISACDEELELTLELRDYVLQKLSSEGWEDPIVVGMSGNGGHLIYRLPDMVNSPESKETIKATLAGLSAKYSSKYVHVDTSVFNPSRITKVLGTMARKGDDIPERPHRRSYMEMEGGGDNG